MNESNTVTTLTQAPLTRVPSILPQETTDDDLIDLWLRGKSWQTRRAYATDIQVFRDFVNRPLAYVTYNLLLDFADSLLELEDSSIKRYMSAIKSLFTFAQKTGYLTLNVGAAYKLPKLPDKTAERILTEEQVQRMLALEENPRNHAILRLLYGAGLRVSELVSLTWDKIHERDGGRAQITVFGKGRHTRHILITAGTWNELNALRGMASPDAPVFTSRGGHSKKGGGPLDTSAVNRIVTKAAKRAGIAANVSPHWMRHAHTSHALDRGAPSHLVQATLGHANLAITGRYAHARPNASSSEYLPV